MTFAGQCDEATARRILDVATGRGVTFLDTADCYPIPPEPETAGRSEEVIGRWLEGRRHDFVLATKCRMRIGHGPNDQGLSRRHILASCEASLKRLKTDYIDLYQAHSPDTETPIDETLRAFDDLVRAGKVRYVGCSNFPAWLVAHANGVAAHGGLARFDSVQPRYNLLHRDIEAELLPYCLDQGVGVIAYNPLAGGFLTAKYQKTTPPPEGTRFTLGVSGELYRERYWQNAQFDEVTRLKSALDAQGVDITAAAVAWVLTQPGISAAIVGASRPEQLDGTLAAVDLKLDEPTREACDAAWFNLPRRRSVR
jgi:aryl-alcohol dehydrogenase (NADP+)